MINSQNKLIAKKSLGQNFLRSEKAIADIVNSISEKYIAELRIGEIEIIEIGGGEGVVTKKLLEKGYAVTVIELDERAVINMSSDTYLSEMIKKGKLKILNQDILKSELSKIVDNKKYIIIGNIPYYITGLIFRHIFEQEKLPLETTLMVQKEVADRVIAKSGKESILSQSVKVYGEVRQVSVVKSGSFVPAPKVDSAIIHISNIQNPFENKIKEREYFQIMKIAFKHPRKIALSNLKKYLNQNQSDEDNKKLYTKIEKYFLENNLQQKRAEDIPLFVWLDLLKL